MAGRLGLVSECFEPFLKTAVAADATLEAMVKPFRLMNFAREQRVNTWPDHPLGSTWHRDVPNRLRKCYDLVIGSPNLDNTNRTTAVFRTGELSNSSDHFFFFFFFLMAGRRRQSAFVKNANGYC